MTDVRVSKGFLITIGVVAGGSLLALAFVLGRESGSGSALPPPAKIERVAPRVRDEPVPLPTPASAPGTSHAEAPPAFVPVSPAAAPGTAAAPSAAPFGSAWSDAGSDDARASVAAYFDTVERVQAGSVSGEAESIAREIASALASGDASGVDKLIGETEAAKAGLAAVAPPAPCAAHHREAVASLDDALDVLRALKTAMASSDPVAALPAVMAKGQALRTRADFLQKEEQALRERYGLRR